MKIIKYIVIYFSIFYLRNKFNGNRMFNNSPETKKKDSLLELELEKHIFIKVKMKVIIKFKAENKSHIRSSCLEK